MLFGAIPSESNDLPSARHEMPSPTLLLMVFDFGFFRKFLERIKSDFASIILQIPGLVKRVIRGSWLAVRGSWLVQQLGLRFPNRAAKRSERLVLFQEKRNPFRF